MKNEFEAVLKTTTPGKVIVVAVYYDKGGANYFSGTTEARGYYLSVCPEERADGMRMYAAFSGVKKCVLPVSRKGSASAALAVRMVLSDVKTADMIQELATRSRLEIADPDWRARVGPVA